MKILILFLLLTAAVSVYGQTDFSGTWKLNTEKSQFNNTPGAPAATKMVVEQKTDSIQFQRNDRPKETLKIDSTASLEIDDLNSKTNVSIKSASDKRSLIETRIYNYSENQSRIIAKKKTRTWTLADDKKTLRIHDYIETTKEGLNYDMILIYDRQ